MTTLFCIAILCVTLTTLALRLTVLGDLSNGGGGGGGSSSPGGRSPAQVEGGGDGAFYFYIARSVRFSSPSAQGDFRIANPESNDYYMRISIINPDNGQELFYTGFLRPGEERRSAALHIQLPSGTYESIVRVTAYDPQTLAQRGSEEQDITLNIG